MFASRRYCEAEFSERPHLGDIRLRGGAKLAADGVISMQQPLSRRTILRGAGVSLALPWMEAIAPAARRGSRVLAEPPLRTAFLFMPCGVRPDHWEPGGTGEQYEIKPHLKALEPLKSEFLLLENLWNAQAVGRNGHWAKVPAWLSGGYVERSTGRDINTGGTSVDQVMASRIGTRTPLPAIQLGVDAPRTGVDNIGGGFARIVGSYISWRDPHTPAAKEIVPQMAFDRLFRTGTPGADPARAQTRFREEASILDVVLEQARSVRDKGSRRDQVKLDEYMESVRSVEQRIQAAMNPEPRWVNKGDIGVNRPPEGIPDDHGEHVRLMLDILLLAFWTDTTRIATFMYGDAQTGRDFSFLEGVNGNFHGISHHRNDAERLAMYETIINWHVDQTAYFLSRMRDLDEGGSSLLDNSMVLFGSTLRDGNTHDPSNLPLILAGRGKGTLKPGRRVQAQPDTPLCNLYIEMMQRMGLEDMQGFGDSTGSLAGLA